MIDRIGQQLGNYRLIGLLGRGGFADTYLGEQIYLKTFAAIKVLQTQLQQQAEQESFYNEARIIARLKHPNIIGVLEFGVDQATNTPYLIMEYASNGTLRQRHPRGVAVPVSTVVPYVRDAASALQYAHTQQIVHRDIKPENMLLGAHNEVLLSDFGIAVISQNTQSPNAQDVAGTVTYMAPEQIQGKARPASDQYALAVVVYEWLCGVVPFSGTYVEVALQHERVAPTPLRQHVPSISPDVERVVLTALEKDPHRRFGSVLAFANALEQASKGTSVAQSGEQGKTIVANPSSLANEQQSKPTEISLNPVPPPYQSGPSVPVQPPYQSGPSVPVQPPYQSGPNLPVQPPYQSGPNLPVQPQPFAATGYGQQNPANTPRFTPPMSGGLYAPPPPQPPVNVQSGYGPSLTPPNNQHTEWATTPAAPPSAPLVQKPAATGRISPLNMLLLGIVALLLILGASGLFYYTGVYRPQQMRVDATNTAVAQVTGTVQAQKHATAVAVAHATSIAAATATVYQDIYTQATSGTPVLTDTLRVADNYGWDHYVSSTGKCNFEGNTYHTLAQSGYSSPCYATATNYNNLAMQVEMTIITGSSAGVLFRAPTDRQNFAGYEAFINTDGTYNVYKISDDKSGSNSALGSGTVPLMHKDLNQMNVLTVVAREGTFYLYVNKQFVTSFQDGSYKSGNIGVIADGGTEASFSNLTVWQL